MKYVLLLFTAIFTFSHGYCDRIPRFDSCEKTYLQPNQISITENGIFVYVDHQWLPAESLHADASGIYADARNWWNWKCPNCGHPDNPWHANVCEKCHRRP